MKMNKKLGSICFGVMSMAFIYLLNGDVSVTQANSNFIGAEAAKQLAMEFSGVSEEDIHHIRWELDYDNRRAEYDIEFWIGNVEYEHDINATTGEILSYEKSVEESELAPTIDSNQNYMSEEEAKAIALADAGLEESEVTFMRSELDYDDGYAEYEIEFWKDLVEYDYEIDAITGEIRSFDYDMESKTPASQTLETAQMPTTEREELAQSNNAEYITEEQAKEIAFADAGVTSLEVSRLKCEFDFDDGYAEYEIEWEIGIMEYEYTISATDGSILERDVEYDD